VNLLPERSTGKGNKQKKFDKKDPKNVKQKKKPQNYVMKPQSDGDSDFDMEEEVNKEEEEETNGAGCN
jgi:hypothetical protein